MSIESGAIRVSTHSRPKAAGGVISLNLPIAARFNSQPPEGGWTGGVAGR